LVYLGPNPLAAPRCPTHDPAITTTPSALPHHLCLRIALHHSKRCTRNRASAARFLPFGAKPATPACATNHSTTTTSCVPSHHLPHIYKAISDYLTHSIHTRPMPSASRLVFCLAGHPPIFDSWCSTTTTTAFSLPHGLCKGSLTTPSTPDQYRSCRNRLLAWRGNTLAPARARYPGILPAQTTHKNQPIHSLYGRCYGIPMFNRYRVPALGICLSGSKPFTPTRS
jgi:hypothetical protein